MFLSTQPYKGTRDFYPEDKRIQNWIFNKLREVVMRFGYREYDGPMLEPFELYAAKSGTELVNQQLYHFLDRGERKMAIRPEMTPTLARMVAAKVQELPRPIRWFSLPNLWRYERPQRGRLREHWQLNVDVLGGDSLLGDVEILTLAASLFDAFGGQERVAIRVNNRRLVDHVFQTVLKLPQEHAAKLSRLVDAKEKMKADAYAQGLAHLGIDQAQAQLLEAFFKTDLTQLSSQYPCKGAEELQELFDLLSRSGVKTRIVFDPSIMRGLDYYTGTVFEAFDVSPENPRALFGGGRYDNLVGMFGKQQLSGMGFGMGDVVLRNFLETHKLLPDFEPFAELLVTTPSRELLPLSNEIAQELRTAGFSVITPLSVDGFGTQLKLASKQQVRLAILLGEEELKHGQVMIKELATGDQHKISRESMVEFIRTLPRRTALTEL